MKLSKELLIKQIDWMLKMDKKEIQRQRMMKYFIDAAKEIIKEEGTNALTARKVGEKAGYSYATIYNYFKDLNGLLIYCVFDFLEDCYRYMKDLKVEAKNSKEKFIQYSLEYFKYFAQRPDLFHIIFIKHHGEASYEIIKEQKQPSVALLLRETLEMCAKDGYITEENVDLLGELATSSIHGKLLFFLKGKHEGTLEDVIVTIEKEINFLIENRGGKQ